MRNQSQRYHSRDEAAGELFQAIRSGDIGRVRAMLDVSPSLVDARARYTNEQIHGAYCTVLTWPVTGSLEQIRRSQALIKLLLEHGAYLKDFTSTDRDAPP
jgi:hypothetical protein